MLSKKIIAGLLAGLCLCPAVFAAEDKTPVQLDIKTILSDKPLPQVATYKVRDGDTIEKIARKYHTTVELIRVRNRLDSDMLHDGQSLKVWAVPFSIVVKKKKNILALKCGDQVVRTYRVATGAGNNTPAGEFTIASRLENPVWFKKGVPILPDDPENALGPRWLGLNKPQYGIHGTIHPGLIGRQVSHGCVRMLNREVEELYTLIPLGTKVVIVD